MKDSAAETTRVEEGESDTLGRGEEHTHTHPNLQIFYGEAGMRAFVCLFLFCLEVVCPAKTSSVKI